MKYARVLLSTTLITFGAYAAESQNIDPFEHAKMLYDASNWSEAYAEFTRIHEAIENGILKIENIDKNAYINGHVNYADVISAKAAGEWNKGNFENAKQLMLKACKHSHYRLEGRQFGREPLNNELLAEEDMNGIILAVYSERVTGAFGDSFYATYLLEYAKSKGATVIFLPQKPLMSLYDRTCLPDALQTQFVDMVASRDIKPVPEHDKAIYLWSILEHYLNDKTVKQHFPVKQCLSGTNIRNAALAQKIAELTQKYGHEPLLVGAWWRSAGPAAKAADWRTLDRDPGAHRILSTIQDMPVLVINLEGLGRKPLSEEELKQRRAEGTQGNSDEIDVTTYPTDNVFSFGPDFDRDIPFGDTIGVMQMIKKRRGVLIGCDTGLCNAAAMVEKDENEYPEESVLAILNERADHRWSDDKVSPRKWHHSNDVLVFQAQKQGQWDEPLAQARKVIQDRLAQFLTYKKQQQK